MFTKTLISLSLVSAALGQLMINTPSSLIVCQPAALSWSGGSAPYYINVLPGGQSTAAPLEQLGTFQTTSTTWTVDLAAGTSVTLSVTDGTGVINYSQQVTILAGTSTACVGTGGGAAAGTTAAATGAATSTSAIMSRTPVSRSGSSTAAAGTSAAAGTTTSARATTSAVPSGSSTAPAAASSSKASSASSLSTVGFAGAIAALFAAML